MTKGEGRLPRGDTSFETQRVGRSELGEESGEEWMRKGNSMCKGSEREWKVCHTRESSA